MAERVAAVAALDQACGAEGMGEGFSGGFSGGIGHDPHILYTLSALQILALCNKMELVDIDAVASFIISLQQEDGSFVGDTNLPQVNPFILIKDMIEFFRNTT